MSSGSRDLTALTEAELAVLSTVLRMLGEPTRLRVLLLLCRGEQSVSELVRLLRMPQPTVSHHLSLLREARLVTTRRQGKSVIYSLDAPLVLAADRCELRIRNVPGVSIRIKMASSNV